MMAFFTTVGFTASFKLLKKGGMHVFFFLSAAIVLVALQNILGVSLAKVINLNPLIGLSTWSVPMTGEHGTSGAFAPVFEKAGAVGATTVAMANTETFSSKYNPSPRAFFIVPLVESLFIDFFNAGTITFFMNLFG